MQVSAQVETYFDN